jgi:hypothetical protein
VIDTTPNIPTLNYDERWREIAAWLSWHPEVTGYVILDDIPDFGPLEEHHVLTDDMFGITSEQVFEAIDILKKPRLKVA